LKYERTKPKRYLTYRIYWKKILINEIFINFSDDY